MYPGCNPGRNQGPTDLPGRLGGLWAPGNPQMLILDGKKGVLLDENKTVKIHCDWSRHCEIILYSITSKYWKTGVNVNVNVNVKANL